MLTSAAEQPGGQLEEQPLQEAEPKATPEYGGALLVARHMGREWTHTEVNTSQQQTLISELRRVKNRQQACYAAKVKRNTW